MSNFSKQQKKKSMYITYSRAKDELYLTDGMFKDIGLPDKEAPNPHYRKAAPMKLYLIDRLKDWIAKNQERVEKAMIRRAKLSAIQLKIHQKKREALLQEINQWIPELHISVVNDKIRNEADEYYLFR